MMHMNYSCVAVVGVDGAGKSTVIDLLARRLEQEGVPVRVEYMGKWHNQVIPLNRCYTWLRSLLKRGGGKTSSSPVIEKSAKPEKFEKRTPSENCSSGASSETPCWKRQIWYVLRDFSLWIEFLLRYVVKLRRKDAFVLCDRYLYDMLLTPHSFLLPWLLRLYPRPRKLFFLAGPGGLVFSRKGQHSPEWIDRAQEDYRKIFTAYRLDWEEFSVEQSAEEIVDALYRQLCLKGKAS